MKVTIEAMGGLFTLERLPSGDVRATGLTGGERLCPRKWVALVADILSKASFFFADVAAVNFVEDDDGPEDPPTRPDLPGKVKAS